MRHGDLTTAASWESLWRQGKGRPWQWIGSSLRARTRWAREYDAAWARLVDAAARGHAIDILELGCAPGTLLEMLHRMRPQHRYAGVDIAVDALAPTRARLAERGCALDLWAGDLRDLELPRKFPLVVSFGLIEHFDDPAEIVRHHARFASPGGGVAVVVPNYAHPVVVGLLERFSPETLATHNLEIMSEPALERCLAAAGLLEIRVGSAAGPLLPVSRSRAGVLGTSYGAAARAWNLASGLLPGMPRLWNGLLWARGTVPRA